MVALEPAISHASDVLGLQRMSTTLNLNPEKNLKKDDDVFNGDATLAETTQAGWRHAAGGLVRREGSTLGTSA